jgi:hypothetical protein
LPVFSIIASSVQDTTQRVRLSDQKQSGNGLIEYM